jgi:hypothetical protein
MTNPLETRPNQVPPRRRRNIGETIEWYDSTIVARIHRLFAAAARYAGNGGVSTVASRSPAHRRSAMNLDVNTLFLVTIYVEAILGLLLLFACVQNTAITAVAWWGFAHLLRRLDHAVRPVRLRARPDLHRPRQQPAVHRLRRDLDRRARLRPSQAAADLAVRRRRALARRLPAAGG